MFHSILVAVDGSPHADLALTHAIDLAECEHARLTLLTAIPQPPNLAYYGGGAAFVQTLIEEGEAEAEATPAPAPDRGPDDLSAPTGLAQRPAPAPMTAQR